MPADFADRVYLADLSSEDATAAFGAGFETATEPPAVSDLLRSLADTHVWATRNTDVLAGLERGDYVLFHRDWGLRCVGQVWGTTADSDAVARFADVDEPAGEWGAVTLTNVQPALDHVSLLSLGMRDARRGDSLYRLDGDVARALRQEYTTPARLVEDAVADPLQFDVPPGGTPGDRRPDPPEPPVENGPRAPDAGVLDAYVSALDGVRGAAWRVLALAAFLLAATLAVVALYRPPTGDPLYVTPPVTAGVAAVGLGAAAAAAVAIHGALDARPGLDSFVREQAAAVRRAGASESGRESAARVAARFGALCDRLDRRTRRLGVAVAAATVLVLVGCVYVAYGLAVQVSTAIRPLSAVALAGFPLLVVAATLAVARERVRNALPGGRPGAGLDVIQTGALSRRVDALRSRLSTLAGRIR